MATTDYRTHEFPILSPRSGRSGKLLSDVSGPEPPSLPPVGVPVGPVRAAGAVSSSASYGFLTECDLSTPTRGSALELLPLSRHQEAAGEDHEAPEVVLIQASHLTDKVAI
jgi:hypothetical protein